MKAFLSFCGICLVVFASITACVASPTLTPMPDPTSTPVPAVDAFTMNIVLSRSINLGNALEAPAEGDWGVTLKEEFFSLIWAKGFSAVRLPVRWSAHAAKVAPYTIDREFFNRVDWAVEQAILNDLAIVINIHHYEEMALDPISEQERFIAIWKQIAQHYQDAPPQVLFELMNEPNGALNASAWNILIAKTLPAIRVSNPTRNVIVGPANWNNVDALDELVLPVEDRHIIVTFHFYNPFQFTHQGAEWVQGSQSWQGTEWKGSSAEKQLLQFDLDNAEQWGIDNQRPIFMGEFGAYSKADMESRIRWTSFLAREAEARNISWSYWEFCSGFGVYDLSTGKWRDELMSALIPNP